VYSRGLDHQLNLFHVVNDGAEEEGDEQHKRVYVYVYIYMYIYIRLYMYIYMFTCINRDE